MREISSDRKSHVIPRRHAGSGNFCKKSFEISNFFNYKLFSHQSAANSRNFISLFLKKMLF